METSIGNVIFQLKSTDGCGFERHSVAVIDGTSHVAEVLDGGGGRDWAIERVLVWSGVPYRIRVVLYRVVLYESS